MKVSFTVNQAETIRLGPSVHSVDTMRDGAGHEVMRNVVGPHPPFPEGEAATIIVSVGIVQARMRSRRARAIASVLTGGASSRRPSQSP